MVGPITQTFQVKAPRDFLGTFEAEWMDYGSLENPPVIVIDPTNIIDEMSEPGVRSYQVSPNHENSACSTEP
jgi:hypothetical protein